MTALRIERVWEADRADAVEILEHWASAGQIAKQIPDLFPDGDGDAIAKEVSGKRANGAPGRWCAHPANRWDVLVQAFRFLESRSSARESSSLGAANASINRELAILKRAFDLAADSDPPRVYHIPHFPMLEENNVRKGFLEQDAYKQLRDALPPSVQLLFVVAYHVGCRRGELLKIR